MADKERKSGRGLDQANIPWSAGKLKLANQTRHLRATPRNFALTLIKIAEYDKESVKARTSMKELRDYTSVKEPLVGLKLDPITLAIFVSIELYEKNWSIIISFSLSLLSDS